MASRNDEDEWENAPDAVSVSLQRMNLGGNNDGKYNLKSGAKTPVTMQPPQPVQDGGSYVAPVSPVTLSAASGADKEPPIDPVFATCLESTRERMTLLKYEDTILRFMRSPTEKCLDFPPLSSYHRLIVHRLAQRFCLQHQVVEPTNPYEAPFDSNGARPIKLYKSPESVIPSVLFINLSSEREQSQSSGPAKKIIIKRRDNSPGGRDLASSNSSDDGNKSVKTVQDREREYAEARARIFGTSSDKPSALPTGSSSRGKHVGTAHIQAQGPDGTSGFASGRGRVVSPQYAENYRDQQHNSYYATPTNSMATHASIGGRDSGVASRNLPEREEYQDEPRQKRCPNPSDWTGSKVTWRNRELEMNDPDFTRNYDMYRPSSYSPYGAAQPPLGAIPAGPMPVQPPVGYHPIDYYEPMGRGFFRNLPPHAQTSREDFGTNPHDYHPHLSHDYRSRNLGGTDYRCDYTRGREYDRGYGHNGSVDYAAPPLPRQEYYPMPPHAGEYARRHDTGSTRQHQGMTSAPPSSAMSMQRSQEQPPYPTIVPTSTYNKEFPPLG